MNITDLVNHLVKEFEIQSILCYGSYAQMLQDDKSDIDLLVLMKHSVPSSIIRKSCYSKFHNIKIVSLDEELASRWDVSWTPVNDRFMLMNQPIDIGFNTISWVKTVIEKLIVENKITFAEFQFRPYTFLGMLESSKILYDSNDFVKKCLSQIRPMPPALKDKIIHSFLPTVKESYEELIDYSDRDIGILAYQFHLFRGLDAAIGILFAINEVYDPASKRIESILFNLKKQPPNLSEFINKTLPRFYENKKAVIQFFESYIKFIEENT